MIHADDRVASVLAQDERLLDVFVATSPVFEKLRNRAMRKTMAKLVTVEQAARIAGVDVAQLVDRLNTALGAGATTIESIDSIAAAPADALPPLPAELTSMSPECLVDVDVREELRAGIEPFARILAAARALPAGRVLRVRAIFEPAPLYAVLAKYGLAHATERLADDDWRVWFHHAAVATPNPAPVATDADTDGDVIILDVRGLEPPEPMVRTLEALAEMPPGRTLVQINVRVPQFLLPKLEERGFTYEVFQQAPDVVRLFIRHRTSGK